MKKAAKLLILLAFLVACAKNDVAEENGIQSTAESIAPTATKSPEAVIEEVAQNNAPVTIRFASYDWAESNYAQLMQTFTAVNPDITIEYVPFSEVLGIDSYSSGAWPEDSGLRLASAADVIDIVFQPEEIAQGVALDLMPLLVADGLGASDFYPSILQGAQQGGSLYYLPAEARPSLFYLQQRYF